MLSDIDKNSREIIYDIKQEKLSTLDAQEKAILMQLTWRVGNVTSRLLQLQTVIDHVFLCRQMANRYPWHGTKISKSDHFYFVWSIFTNHCYIFRERAKKYLNDYNRTCDFFQQKSISVAKFLKRIDKELSDYIRFRGEYIHENEKDHISYRHLKFVELLNNIEHELGQDLKGHYQDTKWDVKYEIDRGLSSMIVAYANIFDVTKHTLASCSNIIYPIYIEAKTNGLEFKNGKVLLPAKFSDNELFNEPIRP